VAPRERACLEQVARGATDTEICAELGLPLEAVYRALRRARLRLRARNRSHAVHLALRWGLIHP
ncbi:MAG TPA: LuxR C-terminal-related transcriptional regulator, partial [Verrucomicrobiae bacterium]|nr:LuxR C-terminal-related transcriptional regulator [Verrucomicrobiae bacterium]